MLLLLLAHISHAGGYYFSDSGIVASGRAGAWVAGADTQFAQYYNPAGLIRVDAPTFSFGGSAVQQAVRFDRIDGAGNALPEVRNISPPFTVPQLGFATPLGDHVGLAVGFTSPFAPSYRYEPDGAQRYSMIDSTIWLFSLGPSIAWQPRPWITVGGGLGVQMLRVDQELKVSTSGFSSDGTDNPQGDVTIKAATWDRFEPFWNLGLLIEPDPRVSIGLSVTPPAAFTARGPGSLDFTGHALENTLDRAVWPDDDVALNIDLPIIVRVGIAVRPRQDLEIELASVYERWSSLADIQVEDIDVTVTSERLNLARDVPESLALSSDFRDTVSVRLGGEWRVHSALEVRAGAMWERGALAPQDLSVTLVDPNKLQLSLGASAFLLDERLRLDGMASLLAMGELDLSDSQVTQTTVPVLTDEVTPGVIGTGSLSSTGFTAGLRAAWVFQSQRRKTPHHTTVVREVSP